MSEHEGGRSPSNLVLLSLEMQPKRVKSLLDASDVVEPSRREFAFANTDNRSSVPHLELVELLPFFLLDEVSVLFSNPIRNVRRPQSPCHVDVRIHELAPLVAAHPRIAIEKERAVEPRVRERVRFSRPT